MRDMLVEVWHLLHVQSVVSFPLTLAPDVVDLPETLNSQKKRKEKTHLCSASGGSHTQTRTTHTLAVYHSRSFSFVPPPWRFSPRPVQF